METNEENAWKYAGVGFELAVNLYSARLDSLKSEAYTFNKVYIPGQKEQEDDFEDNDLKESVRSKASSKKYSEMKIPDMTYDVSNELLAALGIHSKNEETGKKQDTKFKSNNNKIMNEIETKGLEKNEAFLCYDPKFLFTQDPELQMLIKKPEFGNTKSTSMNMIKINSNLLFGHKIQDQIEERNKFPTLLQSLEGNYCEIAENFGNKTEEQFPIKRKLEEIVSFKNQIIDLFDQWKKKFPNFINEEQEYFWWIKREKNQMKSLMKVEELKNEIMNEENKMIWRDDNYLEGIDNICAQIQKLSEGKDLEPKIQVDENNLMQYFQGQVHIAIDNDMLENSENSNNCQGTDFTNDNCTSNIYIENTENLNNNLDFENQENNEAQNAPLDTIEQKIQKLGLSDKIMINSKKERKEIQHIKKNEIGKQKSQKIKKELNFDDEIDPSSILRLSIKKTKETPKKSQEFYFQEISFERNIIHQSYFNVKELFAPFEEDDKDFENADEDKINKNDIINDLPNDVDNFDENPQTEIYQETQSFTKTTQEKRHFIDPDNMKKEILDALTKLKGTKNCKYFSEIFREMVDKYSGQNAQTVFMVILHICTDIGLQLIPAENSYDLIIKDLDRSSRRNSLSKQKK